MNDEHYSYRLYADPAMADRFDAMRFSGPIGTLLAEDAGPRDRGVPRPARRARRCSMSAPARGARPSRWPRRGARVTGVDASAEMLRVARSARGRRRRRRLTFEVGDAHQLAYRATGRSTARSACGCSCTRPTGGGASRNCAGWPSDRVVFDYPAACSAAALQACGRRAARPPRAVLSRRTACCKSADVRRALEAAGFRDRAGAPAVRPAHRAAQGDRVARRSPRRVERRAGRASASCGCWARRSRSWRCDARASHRRDRVHRRPPGAPAPPARRRGARARARPRTGARRALAADGIELCDGRPDRPCLASSRALDGVDIVYNIGAMYRQAAASSDDVPRDQRDGGRPSWSRPARRRACGAWCTAARSASTATSSIRRPARTRRFGRATSISGRSSKASASAARRRRGPGMELVIARPSGIYGPGDRRLLKLFRGVARRRFVTLGSGEIFYHLTYVEDLAEGFRLCGEVPAAAGRTYILAGGEVTSLNELVRRIAAAAGVRAAVAPPAGVARLARRRGVRGGVRAAGHRAAAVPPARGLLHEEPGVRHLARARRAGVRPEGRPRRGHPPHAGLVPRTGVAVMADIPKAQDQLFDARQLGARQVRPRSSSAAPGGWRSSSTRLITLVEPGRAGRARPRPAQGPVSAAARRLRPQRRVRAERRPAPPGQDPHRRQRRHRRQLPARRQGRRQRGHHDRQRRLRRAGTRSCRARTATSRWATGRTSASTARSSRPAA